MILKANRILPLCFVTALTGCDIPDTGVIEVSTPPFIVDASIAPTVIDVNKIGGSLSDPIDTIIAASITVEDQDGASDIAAAAFSLVGSDGEVIAGGQLTDDGTDHNQQTGDGVYSTSFIFHLQRKDVGAYNFQFQARDKGNLSSNTIVKQLIVKNTNNHKPILFGLAMPDTVFVPASGDTSFVKVSLSVADSEGLPDIASVTLTSVRPDSSIVGTFRMFDDGSVVPQPPFNIASGDSTANDGRYTLRIPLVSSTQKNTYRDFFFRALDRSGESSDMIARRIYIQ